MHDVSGVGTPVDLNVIKGHLGSRVNWVPGGLSFDASTVVASRAGDASRIFDELSATDEVTLEAWVKPANATQNGRFTKAIIVTMGTGSGSNFDLYQIEDDYSGDVARGLGTKNVTASDAAKAGTMQHVVYTRTSTTQNIYVNDVQLDSWFDNGGLRGSPGRPLALANRSEASMPWLGEIHLVAIYDRALSFVDIDQNFRAGPNPDMVIPDPLPPLLQAGDSNQDLTFDQFDIIQVAQAAKYLTCESAEWGEGDWDGAVGSACFVGNPPVGDGVFNQFDIITAQQAGIYLTGAYAVFTGPTAEFEGSKESNTVFRRLRVLKLRFGVSELGIEA